MEKIFNNFWDEKFWLPENITWKDVEPGTKDGIVYRNYDDLLWSIPLAIAIIALRLSLVKYLFNPLGTFFKIKSKKIKMPTENAVFEQKYRKCNKLPTDAELTNLSKQTDISKREIERWWRKRRAHDRPTSLDKFNENCWHFMFYSLNFIFGLSILWNKSWMWNFIDMFREYPRHSLDNGLWWYYNITLAFYTAQTVLHFFETRRKDFWQMFIHHILTISLILTSWITNFIRGGSLLNLIHDIADVFLEVSKISKIVKFEKLTSVLFISFVFVWICTRLGMYLRIFVCMFFENLTFAYYPFFFVAIAMHLFLFILNIMWTFMIFRVISKYVKQDILEDTRSSSDSDEKPSNN